MNKKIGIYCNSTGGAIRQVVGNASLDKSIEMNMHKLFTDMANSLILNPDFKKLLSSGKKMTFKVTVEEN